MRTKIATSPREHAQGPAPASRTRRREGKHTFEEVGWEPIALRPQSDRVGGQPAHVRQVTRGQTN